MRIRTVAVVLAVLAGLLGAAAVGLGVFGGESTTLTAEWVSGTGREVTSNHHAVAAGRPGGRGMVYAPVSGRANTTQCALYGLSAANGSTDWTYAVPPADCTIHSVADPTLADYDDDGTVEVLAGTTERAVVAVDPATGAVEFRRDLGSYGYSKPVVTDFVGDDAKEIIVVDAHGTVYVLRPNGSEVWSKKLDRYTWGQPAVADFDDDGDPELTVGVGGEGHLYLFERNGTVAWRRTDSLGGSITWLTTGQADGDPAREIVTATAAGGVAMFDGTDGRVEWERDFGRLAAVRALGDGDGDGAPEVYAVARDGKLRSIAVATGDVEWTTTLTTADVQMMPPPSLGDVDGDDSPELVAATNDGTVAVVDPVGGDVVARYERDVPVFAPPTLADVDADGRSEAFVIYGDGRVVALSVPEGG
ncbi:MULTISPECIES: PQQ-binding-like beta-propeller repeat protein [Halorussus]|uniref:outer membrane protein assembly factor BamB family protein n=1 Tax=Halorussus TaxID=1070314 RepID=UPI000E21159A|nr:MULTISPECIES: PQQ-binding-like beta-propeller repeat protein [Halorussus]NHN58101.1 PQQ-binding-like beta-propeller repeat protein [Halorussus sp. JP-T4]